MLQGSPRFVVSTAVLLWVHLTAIPLDAQVIQPARNPVAVQAAPAAPDAPAALPAAGSDAFAAAPPSFTLSFEGGTVKAYVDLIAKQGDKRQQNRQQGQHPAAGALFLGRAHQRYNLTAQQN